LRDRGSAARELARLLAPYTGRAPLVLAVPRGGVPLGAVLAERLGGDLDVVLAHKLRDPHEPEVAIGAVDEAGEVTLREPGVDPDYVRLERARQLAGLRERRRSYSRAAPRRDPRGRLVIVVDDGVATGATLSAALRSVRAQEPRRLIAAVGIAPLQAALRLEREADDVVIVHTPRRLSSVGELYADFPQVSDEEVVELLRGAALRSRNRRGDRSLA